MDRELDVSIIVLSYNPNLNKMFQTLNSVINQKKIDFEVIVCDDGSKENHFDKVKQFFENKKFENYILVDNKVNQGTVKNYLSGLKKASGKYVYAISPGDYIFDENTIKDFFDYAVNKKSRICFGNAVYYYLENESYVITEQLNIPYRPKVYYKAKNIFENKINFFFEGQILGVTYFRERQTALKYIEQISQYAKFVEDSTSSAAALADGVGIDYFDRNIAWYEYGTGISTQGEESPWAKLTNKDYRETMVALKQLYPKDRVISAASMVATVRNKWKRRIFRILKYPVISFKVLKNKNISVRMSEKSEKLQNDFKEYIANVLDK